MLFQGIEGEGGGCIPKISISGRCCHFLLFTRMHVDLDGLYIMYLPLFMRIVMTRLTYNLWGGFWSCRRSERCVSRSWSNGMA